MNDTSYQAMAAEAAAACESAPNDPTLALHAAEMFLRAGAPDRAIDFARSAVLGDLGSVRARRTLSGLLDAGGDRAEAIRVAHEAVSLDPADAELRLHLGGMLAAEQRWREAAEHLSIHVSSAAVTPHGWRLLSSVLYQAGLADRAEKAARHALAADPGNTEYAINLASILCARGHFDEALAALASADPDDVLVWRALAHIHTERGEPGEALNAAERSLALAPDDPESRAILDRARRLCAIPARSDASVWRLPARPVPAPRERRTPGLTEDIASRWRVIYAIMLRDVRTRFGHTRLGYLWAILEPIGHLGTLGVVFFQLNQAPPPVGDNLFVFYITGLIPFLLFAHISQHVMQAAEAGSAMLRLPVIKRTDVMVAQGLRQAATEVLVGTAIFSAVGLLGGEGMPADPLTAMAAVALIGLLAIGVGAVNMVACGFFHSFDTFYAAAIRLLYFGSGIYYSPIAMPDWIRTWLAWNPILQGIEFFRSGFYRQYEPHWLDVGYLLGWVIASVGIGFAAERATRQRLGVPA